jgi:uncharacterized phage protein gp47/JayE
MAYGLLSTGFAPKPQSVIREELDDACRTAYGQSIKLGDKTVLGQINGIMSERLSELWDLAQAVASSQDPDQATGAAQDALAALTGTLRDAATESTVDLLLIGTVGTLVSAGSRAANGIDEEFATTAAGTMIACASWAASTAYVTNQVRQNDGGKIYIVITSGTSAGAGGPTGTAADITDGTVHWKYIGTGPGVIAVPSEATETGPIVAVAGDITQIITPVSGWSAVYNILDADVGTDEETDEHLRIKREEELAASGSSPIDALRAALLQVEDVTAVTVFYNNTDTTDADGIPPHAVEALVRDGADQDIFDALLTNVAVGIKTYGNTSGTAVDDVGTSHAISFTRPDEIEIYVDITIEYDATLYPADGDDQIKAAIVAYGDALATGVNVRASAISAQAFQVPGVLGVTATLIDDAPAPATSTTVAIALRELAVFDTSRITVTSGAVTP